MHIENNAPNITITTNPHLGKYNIVPISINDSHSGIKKVDINILINNMTINIGEKKIGSFFSWNNVKQKDLTAKILFSIDRYSFYNNGVVLQIVAWDRSLRSFGLGNKKCIEKKVKIDTYPSKIKIINSTKYINQGGAGVIKYKHSKPCLVSGVMIGNDFFNGYPGYFKDKSIYLAFFAAKYNQNMDDKIFILATDCHGNKSRVDLECNIVKKKFFKDDIILSDQFLNKKIPEFYYYFKDKKNTNTKPIEQFLLINKKIRKCNIERIRKICSKSEHKIMWDKEFSRLPHSVSKAKFADDRNYIYDDEIIDHQIHLGVDLASNAKSFVPSGNNGKVIFSGDLGIYGNTIIIDHGFSLFSLYSHLSKIYVQKDQFVHKDMTIGQTGETGLAGGDHLHFSMMINNTYINPTEWWDKTWIENSMYTVFN